MGGGIGDIGAALGGDDEADRVGKPDRRGGAIGMSRDPDGSGEGADRLLAVEGREERAGGQKQEDPGKSLNKFSHKIPSAHI